MCVKGGSLKVGGGGGGGGLLEAEARWLLCKRCPCSPRMLCSGLSLPESFLPLFVICIKLRCLGGREIERCGILNGRRGGKEHKHPGCNCLMCFALAERCVLFTGSN